MTAATCNVEFCSRSLYGKTGWCPMHYQRVRKYGDPGSARPRRRGNGTEPKPCGMSDCDEPAHGKGYCHSHYWALYKHGDPAKRKPPSAGHLDSCGYRLVRVAPNVWKKEHRLVMEETLGRPLYPGESVHHINGVRTDNRPDNLELWVSTQPAGQRPEDLVKWAGEVLRRYG